MITPLERKQKHIKLKTRRVLKNDYGWRANAAVDIYNLLLIVMERQANISKLNKQWKIKHNKNFDVWERNQNLISMKRHRVVNTILLDKREWAKRANPCAPWHFFKIYLNFARVLQRLFLSVVSVTRAVYFSRERDMFRRQTFEVWQPLQ